MGMTKTYTAKAHGKTYTMTATDTTTPKGGHGVLVTCSCATHVGTSGKAIIATPTMADSFPKGNIHGHVTMAHGPQGVLAAKMGKAWKA